MTIQITVWWVHEKYLLLSLPLSFLPVAVWLISFSSLWNYICHPLDMKLIIMFASLSVRVHNFFLWLNCSPWPAKTLFGKPGFKSSILFTFPFITDTVCQTIVWYMPMYSFCIQDWYVVWQCDITAQLALSIGLLNT